MEVPNSELYREGSYHTLKNVETLEQVEQQRVEATKNRWGGRGVGGGVEWLGVWSASVTLENANQVPGSTCVICTPSGRPVPPAHHNQTPSCGRNAVIKFRSRATARQSVKIIKSNVHTPCGPENV